MRAIILSITLLLASCSTIEKTSDTPMHYKGARIEDGFRNLYIPDKNKNIFDFLSMKWFDDYVWADHFKLADTVPRQPIDIDGIKNPEPVQITWIGHSTFLIQVNGLNILTDPIFSDRASLVSFAGPKRYVPHMMDYDELPEIDHVIISHNHYDHLDENSIKRIGSNTTYHVPLGLTETISDWFEHNNKPSIIEYDWWENKSYEQISFKALPSQHWSARGLFDRMDTLWASWLIEIGGQRIYFAGDTGFSEKLFKEIGNDLKYVDIAILPIGGYEPRSFMKDFHINPEEALKIHQLINARMSIGMHYGTFPLTAEAPMEPVNYIKRLLTQKEYSDLNFKTMELGSTLINR